MSTDWSAAREFVVEAIDAGWNVMLLHGKDTGDSPFVSVEAKRGDRHIRVSWHTRHTGTYRLFSCAIGRHDVSLKAARAELTS